MLSKICCFVIIPAIETMRINRRFRLCTSIAFFCSNEIDLFSENGIRGSSYNYSQYESEFNLYQSVSVLQADGYHHVSVIAKELLRLCRP